MARAELGAISFAAANEGTVLFVFSAVKTVRECDQDFGDAVAFAIIGLVGKLAHHPIQFLWERFERRLLDQKILGRKHAVIAHWKAHSAKRSLHGSFDIALIVGIGVRVLSIGCGRNVVAETAHGIEAEKSAVNDESQTLFQLHRTQSCLGANFFGRCADPRITGGDADIGHVFLQRGLGR